MHRDSGDVARRAGMRSGRRNKGDEQQHSGGYEEAGQPDWYRPPLRGLLINRQFRLALWGLCYRSSPVKPIDKVDNELDPDSHAQVVPPLIVDRCRFRSPDAAAPRTTAVVGGGGDTKLTLVAYSTPEEAYKELIPAFNKTTAGKGVAFDQSYAASGEQSRAVEGGLPADVVEFSLEPDMTRLVDAGLVDKSWNQNKYDGFVTNSVVVLMVRKGNPKNIKGWDDLIKDDAEVLVPNPFTSGGAKWDIMAGYGAQLEDGKTEDQAKDYLTKLFDHVPVLDKSARESLQTFSSGKGDVLVGYENEAILAQQQGEDLDYIVPDQTLLIQNPVAVDNESESPDKAKAFVDFLYTPEGSGDLREQGLQAGRGGHQDHGGLPDAAEAVRDHEVRRLGARERRVLRPGEGRDRGDIQVPGEEHCLRLAKQPPHLLLRRRRRAACRGRSRSRATSSAAVSPCRT